MPPSKTSPILYIVIIGLLLAALPAAALAQTPVVHAVLFFSPTCGHCEKVIQDVLPPLQEKYGDQLDITLINVNEDRGSSLYTTYQQVYQVPVDRLGVPALLIGDTYLVGSLEIPEKLPELIDTYLAEGGVGIPSLPGLAEATPSTDAPVSTVAQTTGWREKFMRDPLANSIAVVVLAGMIISLAYNLYSFLKPVDEESKCARGKYDWVIPVLSVAGLFVAGYLTYIEISQRDALCGPIGDCNSVQRSPYAKVFGFLPVAVLGLMGYAGILAAWVIGRLGSGQVNKIATLAMWGMALFGILFSMYLTFLEPFVIGATCAWCITTAIIITILLWMTTCQATMVMDYE